MLGGGGANLWRALLGAALCRGASVNPARREAPHPVPLAQRSSARNGENKRGGENPERLERVPGPAPPPLARSVQKLRVPKGSPKTFFKNPHTGSSWQSSTQIDLPAVLHNVFITAARSPGGPLGQDWPERGAVRGHAQPGRPRAQRSPASAGESPAQPPLLPRPRCCRRPTPAPTGSGRRWAPKLPAPGGNQNGQGFLLCRGATALCEGQCKQWCSSRWHRYSKDDHIPKTRLKTHGVASLEWTAHLWDTHCPMGFRQCPVTLLKFSQRLPPPPTELGALRGCSRVTEAFRGSLLSIAFSTQQLSRPCSLSHHAEDIHGPPPRAAGSLELLDGCTWL
ncbi:uncharacterized protein LOC121671131 [Corvus kubaryi]|uniref:uncharacterized protein LOC121671131 n=1 Tax=Corvus kubaryi TaxID=68294 RepID=UPI001C053829|nr:uncharacterized protein LOC121671131 [Corvus kubaryi]